MEIPYKASQEVELAGLQIHTLAESEFSPEKTSRDLINELADLTDEICAHFGYTSDDPRVQEAYLYRQYMTRVPAKADDWNMRTHKLLFDSPTLKTTRPFSGMDWDDGTVSYSFGEGFTNWSTMRRKNSDYMGRAHYRWQRDADAVDVLLQWDAKGHHMGRFQMDKPEDIQRLKAMIQQAYPPTMYRMGAVGMRNLMIGLGGPYLDAGSDFHFKTPSD